MAQGLTSKSCKTLGQDPALQGSVAFAATVMIPEHFSRVWERLWEFICQMWLIFAALPGRPTIQMLVAR